MATLAKTNPTLLDAARRTDPNGRIAMIAELLSETNEVLDDAVWVEGNLPTGHRTTIRTGLPDTYWRKINQGTPRSKSKTAQVDDACGILNARSAVDVDLLSLNGNSAQFRATEDLAFIESMNQSLVDALIYGDSNTEPEKFLGLVPRFSSTTAANGENILLSDGSGSDNTSIWLVVWSPLTAHMIYPKGSKAGLEFKDLGEQTVEDADGNPYQAMETLYKMRAGLTVRDWRYVVRIANIDLSNLTKDAATGSDLVDLMTQALELVNSTTMGRPAFYCNRDIRSFLRRQIKNAKNMNLSLETVAGKRVVTFDGIPVRRCDALLNTETVVA